MSEAVQRIDLGFVNAYLVTAGDGFILVDTGMPFQWERLEGALRQAGCLPDRLRLVVITHGDADHTGNCARLQRELHVKLAMHAADAEMARTGVSARRTSRSLMGRLFLLFSSRRRGKGGPDTFTPDILLADGQGLAEFGLDGRVIHTPGHTAGSIAILTARGDLLVGDTISNRKRPDVAPFIQDAAELRRSVALLKGQHAVTVYPGHGQPFAFEALAAVKNL